MRRPAPHQGPGNVVLPPHGLRCPHGRGDPALRALAVRLHATDRPAEALSPGARLPGERDLAEEYGVALGTARRAIEELRDRGLVVTLASKGSFVVEPD